MPTVYNDYMSIDNSTPKLFRQLRWKLTFSYTLVTVSALFTIELLLMVGFTLGLVGFLNSGYLQKELIDATSTEFVPILRPYLVQTPPDIDGISDVLERIGIYSQFDVPFTFEATDELFVVTGDGRLLAARPAGLLGEQQIGQVIDEEILTGLSSALQAALAGEQDVDKLYTRARPGEKVIITVPILDEAQVQVLGVLVALGEVPSLSSFLSDALPILGVSVFLITIVAGMIGSIYGFIAARGLVERLNRISSATLAWSEGDFSKTVDDKTGDELSQLAQRLNYMARQLEDLLVTRNELAVMEERNRLARELHDSVKQQSFAAAAQINAARNLMTSDLEAAGLHLQEAEQIINELRSELSNLIRQLRPASLDDNGLTDVLQKLTRQWSRQNEIKVSLKIDYGTRLPLEVEQDVLRIVQEAFANIARHSHAQNVWLHLIHTDVEVTCEIRDDGIGFIPDEVRGGIGLSSMKERAAALGGNLSIRSGTNVGTSITLILPVSE